MGLKFFMAPGEQQTFLKALLQDPHVRGTWRQWRKGDPAASRRERVLRVAEVNALPFEAQCNSSEVTIFLWHTSLGQGQATMGAHVVKPFIATFQPALILRASPVPILFEGHLGMPQRGWYVDLGLEKEFEHLKRWVQEIKRLLLHYGQPGIRVERLWFVSAGALALAKQGYQLKQFREDPEPLRLPSIASN